MPIIAIVKTHYIVCLFYKRKGALICQTKVIHGGVTDKNLATACTDKLRLDNLHQCNRVLQTEGNWHKLV